MSRSIKKIPVFKGAHRASSIFPFCVGRTYSIHNGMQFVSILVSDNMVGYKFGDFVRTRYQIKARRK